MAPKSTTLPKNWPPNLPYLTSSTYCKTLTPTHKTFLKTKPNDALCPPEIAKGPCPLVKITPIADPSHPANGQYGLFATRYLKPDTFILRYLGDIHHSSPSPPTQSTPSDEDGGVETRQGEEDPHAKSNYDLSLDREMRIGIDADKKGNEARFINDYRGVKERANAEFREIWDEKGKERGMGVWVLGGKGREKGIKKGEEILVSYGRGFWGARKAGED